jgi:hypothetical protein
MFWAKIPTEINKKNVEIAFIQYYFGFVLTKIVNKLCFEVRFLY